MEKTDRNTNSSQVLKDFVWGRFGHVFFGRDGFSKNGLESWGRVGIFQQSRFDPNFMDVMCRGFMIIPSSHVSARLTWDLIALRKISRPHAYNHYFFPAM